MTHQHCVYSCLRMGAWALISGSLCKGAGVFEVFLDTWNTSSLVITLTVSTLKLQDYTWASKIYSWVLWCRPTVPTLDQPKPKDQGLNTSPGCVLRHYVQNRNEQRKLYTPVYYGCSDITA